MSFFELTGWPVFVMAVTLAAIVLFVAVFLVPRYRKPGASGYIIQFVSIALVTILTLLVIFLKLNNDNQWYGNWGDLATGGDGGSVATQTAGLTAPTRATAAELPHAPFTNTQLDPRGSQQIGAQVDPSATGGQWATFELSGKESQVTQQVTVWLPPSYFTDKDRAFPVITAFTGFPGSVKTYSKSMNFDQHIKTAVRDSAVREPIVVIPDVFPGNHDTECVDGNHGKYETFVSQDVVSWIRENLRVSDDPQAWSTFGYSAGGWCSSMFTVRHPEIWGNSINMAGYFAPDYSKGQEWVTADPAGYDLSKVVEKNSPDVNIWFFTGGEDTPAIKAVEKFKETVKDPTGLAINTSQTGGHRVPLWTAQIETSLKWLGQVSPYFAALRS